MKMKTFGFTTLILLCIALPVVGEVKVKTTVTEFKIKQLPEKESSANDRKGTTVLLELSSVSEGKKLTGAEIDGSKISFKDSTGKDLFAAGKKARVDYDKKGGSYGGLRSVENSLSVNTPALIGRDIVQPGRVYLRCFALATPAKKANGVAIQGEIKVFTESDRTKTNVITKAQLTSGKVFKFEDLSFQFKSFGGGFENGRSYSSYELSSLAGFKKFEVAGKTREQSPVVFDGEKVKVYSDELADTDQIKITYSLPDESTLKLNLEVTLGSVGN